MKTYTQEELKETLTLHRMWFNKKDGGVRADFRNANLNNVDLSMSFLVGANMIKACLRKANLRGADLRGASFIGADLRGADLTNAILARTYFNEANLRYTKLPNFQICPQEGDFIAWKKVQGNHQLKLLITGPRISLLFNRACRAQSVKVLAGYKNGIKIQKKVFKSGRDGEFVYRVGETISVPDYNPDIRDASGPGIYFWTTKEEAMIRSNSKQDLLISIDNLRYQGIVRRLEDYPRSF